MDFGSGGGGPLGGLFSAYNQYLNYKNLKNQESAQTGNLSNQLNQANNNLAVTQEQAPLVPQQAADSFAARGVGQSTFGNGMGNQWGANPSAPTNTIQYTNPDSGAATNPQGQPITPQGQVIAGSAGTLRAPTAQSVMTNGSGEGQGVGTGLQRARDLSSAMVSNATSSQAAASNALDQYRQTVANNRHQYYMQQMQNWVNMIGAMFL